jgi:hypothetical protein
MTDIRIRKPADPLQSQIDERLAAKRGEQAVKPSQEPLKPPVLLMAISARLKQIAADWVTL